MTWWQIDILGGPSASSLGSGALVAGAALAYQQKTCSPLFRAARQARDPARATHVSSPWA
jgi:hypothetical protein